MVQVNQNPYYFAALGGLILGIATTLNYALRGKVTGMSGMLFGIFSWQKKDIPDKIGIFGGMIVVSGVFFDIFGYNSYNRFTPFGPAEEITLQTSYIGFGLAGLLVGFGTKLGNGCTSGHGLCGLSRLSFRSFIAVIVFLIFGIVIATTQKHVSLGPFSDQALNPQLNYDHMISANVCIGIGALLPIMGGIYRASQDDNEATGKQIAGDQLLSFLVGVVFGLGLLVAGMVRRSNIIDFLGLDKEWNPSLLFVLGVGVLVNLISFNYMIRVKKCSILGNSLFNPTNSTIDWKLLLGATCFGMGWGMGGLCPGPAIMQLAVFTVPVHVIWLTCCGIGMLIARGVQKCASEEEESKQKKKVEAGSGGGSGIPVQTDTYSPDKSIVRPNPGLPQVELDRVEDIYVKSDAKIIGSSDGNRQYH